MTHVISFCLYGPYNKKYYKGLLENLQIINKKLPTFYIYISFGNDIDKSIIEDIKMYKNIIYKIYDLTGDKIKSFRFIPLDNGKIDILFSRDIDSRINKRDLWCINDFIKSKYLVHIIRDHKNHTFPIMAGMVGFRKEFLKHINSFTDIIKLYENITFSYLTDQIILANNIYKKYINSDIFLTHSSKNIFNENNFVQIPLLVNKETFIGQVIEYDDNDNKKYVYDYLDY
jgi:hypothetical protein